MLCQSLLYNKVTRFYIYIYTYICVYIYIYSLYIYIHIYTLLPHPFDNHKSDLYVCESVSIL